MKAWLLITFALISVLASMYKRAKRVQEVGDTDVSDESQVEPTFFSADEETSMEEQPYYSSEAVTGEGMQTHRQTEVMNVQPTVLETPKCGLAFDLREAVICQTLLENKYNPEINKINNLYTC